MLQCLIVLTLTTLATITKVVSLDLEQDNTSRRQQQRQQNHYSTFSSLQNKYPGFSGNNDARQTTRTLKWLDGHYQRPQAKSEDPGRTPVAISLHSAAGPPSASSSSALSLGRYYPGYYENRNRQSTVRRRLHKANKLNKTSSIHNPSEETDRKRFGVGQKPGRSFLFGGGDYRRGSSGRKRKRPYKASTLSNNAASAHFILSDAPSILEHSQNYVINRNRESLEQQKNLEYFVREFDGGLEDFTLSDIGRHRQLLSQLKHCQDRMKLKETCFDRVWIPIGASLLLFASNLILLTLYIRERKIRRICMTCSKTYSSTTASSSSSFVSS